MNQEQIDTIVEALTDSKIRFQYGDYHHYTPAEIKAHVARIDAALAALHQLAEAQAKK